MPIRLTRAVKVILIACVASFLIQQTVDQFLGGNLLSWFALIPSAFVFDHRVWQIFTYAFLHADVMHLFLNLMMLAFMGGELEAVWGTARFLRYYFLCSVSAGLFYLFLQMVIWKGDGLHVPMVGASGAVYGLLMAYGLLFGERVMLFMLLFPMKAKHFVWILAGLEFFTTVFSGRGGLSSSAHLGGMVAGFVFLWGRASFQVAQKNRQLKKLDVARFRRSKRKTSQHLKLIINNKKDGAAESEEDFDHEPPKTWH